MKDKRTFQQREKDISESLGNIDKSLCEHDIYNDWHDFVRQWRKSKVAEGICDNCKLPIWE